MKKKNEKTKWLKKRIKSISQVKLEKKNIYKYDRAK